MANKTIQSILRLPLIGKLFLIPYRFRVSSKYIFPTLKTQLKWLFASNETTNFTYELSEINRQHLISFIASITNKSYSKVEQYIIEIEQDKVLQQHLQSSIQQNRESYKADTSMKYGRRIGWYAFIRILKPKLIIETGVDKGLGSCIITSALARNKGEGHSGKYLGTDINPKAGYLLTPPYNQFGKILYGDSIESLKQLKEPIDMFINDSDHSSEYEAEEYEVVREKLSKSAIILGDNSHITDKLLKFALKTNRPFYFFKEEPKNHWHQGAGIGVVYEGEQFINNKV